MRSNHLDLLGETSSGISNSLFSFKDEQTENKTKKHGDHERKRQKKAMWDNDLLFRKRI